MKKQFFEDIQEICNMVAQRDDNLNALFLEIDNMNHPDIAHIVKILHTLDLPNTSPNRFALLSRLVNLSESPIVQVLKKAHKTADEIKEAKKILFDWTRDYHTNSHKDIIDICKNKQLLTPFYRQILQGVHAIGIAFNDLHFKWKFKLIEEINPTLLESFKGDVNALLDALLDIQEVSSSGEKSDRSYSIPQYKKGTLKAIPYAVAFKAEIKAIKKAIKRLLKELKNEGDDVFSAKDDYIAYFRSIEVALSQEDLSELLESWREVDRAWMRIKTPIQPTHPLEYYEDHYRKSVAPEWDLRICDVEHGSMLPIKEQMQATFDTLYQHYDVSNAESLYNLVKNSLHNTDLYLSLPAFYYGAEIDGLFSAQVVPNDEVVSYSYGKKIFAFPKRVLRLSQYRPFMRLSNEIFPEDFLRESREMLFYDELTWHKLYQISTIGHEFGHILWIDTDTELMMNIRGNFKNIEEFKATTGGLMNFFMNDSMPLYAPLRHAVLSDIVRRCVGLIAWMEQGEVLPYYCEGLIHLHLLFQANILSFEDSRLSITISDDSYRAIKALYMDTYRRLVEVYVAKQDASLFLDSFAIKDENGNFKPVDPTTRSFVEYYWSRYQDIGQEIDTSTKHRQYLNQMRLKKVG